MKVEGRFIDAVAPSGLAILNAGMMLERVSNGRIPAGVHRVVAPAGATGERFSVVQFCHPSPATILAPVASSVTAAHPPRFSPIEGGASLDQVLWDINLRGE